MLMEIHGRTTEGIEEEEEEVGHTHHEHHHEHTDEPNYNNKRSPFYQRRVKRGFGRGHVLGCDHTEV